MNSLVRKLLLGGLLVAAGLACAPTPAKADPVDPYWRHYWGWYDGTYRPYFHRRYYYAPPSLYGYPPPPAPYYGGTTYYSPAPPAFPYAHGGVVVGPVVRYGWW
jgi:hypothetical protein